MSEITRTKLRPASAYAIAVKNGFEGTEKEWLESLAAQEYADRTEEFSRQTNYSSPTEYLRSLGVGAWKVIDSGTLYMAKIMDTGMVTVCFERCVTDDPFVYDEIWLNDKLVYRMDTEVGQIIVDGKNVSNDAGAVHYTEEAKNDAEKQQARQNIGAIGEDDVAEMEVATAATAEADKNLDTKLITPAAVMALLDIVCPPAIVPQVNSAYSGSASRKARAYDASKTYAAGDVCYAVDWENNNDDDSTYWYVRSSGAATVTLTGDFENKGRLITLPEDTDMRKYELAAQQGNVKLKFGNYYMLQSSFVSGGTGLMRLVFEKTTAEALMQVNLYYFSDTGKIAKITYSASGVSPT